MSSRVSTVVLRRSRREVGDGELEVGARVERRGGSDRVGVGEVEVLELRGGEEAEAAVVGLLELAPEHLARVALEGRAVEVGDVAERPGRRSLRTAAEGQDLEGLRVRVGEDVALLDPAEAVDRRAVEGHPLVEGVLELGRRDREGLRDAEDVGEPELDELDAPLFDGPQHVLTLALHRRASSCRLGGLARVACTVSQAVAPRLELGPPGEARVQAGPVTAGRYDSAWAALRIALCQLDAVVGDLEGNVEPRPRRARRAPRPAGADLAVFPELVLTGYPPEDLLLEAGVRRRRVARALETVAAATPVLRGGRRLRRRRAATSTTPRRSAPAGRCTAIWRKELLPNYGVFDERRWFSPGDGDTPLFSIAGRPGRRDDLRGRLVPDGPVARQAAGGAELVVSLNASPYRAGVLDERAADARDAGRRRVLRARLRQPRRRPGRAGLRRRLDGLRRRRARSSPRRRQFVRR